MEKYNWKKPKYPLLAWMVGICLCCLFFLYYWQPGFKSTPAWALGSMWFPAGGRRSALK